MSVSVEGYPLPLVEKEKVSNMEKRRPIARLIALLIRLLMKGYHDDIEIRKAR